MPASLENSAVATGLEKVSFHSNIKQRQWQRCLNYCTIALILHASKVMLKILQARLQQYMNRELPDVQSVFRKSRGTRDQICYHPLDHWKSKRVPEKHLLLLYAKAFDCVDHNKLWKIFKEMGVPDHLTCLLRYLYVGQEAIVRTTHGTNWLAPSWKRSTRLYVAILLA